MFRRELVDSRNASINHFIVRVMESSDAATTTTKKPTSKFTVGFYIALFLISGTCSLIFGKFLYLLCCVQSFLATRVSLLRWPASPFREALVLQLHYVLRHDLPADEV